MYQGTGKAADRELHNAIQTAIGDPNLTSFMYIKNFDYLIDQGGYIDTQIKVIQGGSRKMDARKLHAMHRVDIEDRIKLSLKKDDRKIDTGEVVDSCELRKARIVISEVKGSVPEIIGMSRYVKVDCRRI